MIAKAHAVDLLSGLQYLGLDSIYDALRAVALYPDWAVRGGVAGELSDSEQRRIEREARRQFPSWWTVREFVG